MRNEMRNGINIHADIEDFGAAQEFVGNLLDRASVNREVANETMVVFEAVFEAVVMQGIDRGTIINISAENRLGNIYLKISYEGKRFELPEEGDNDISFELRLLEGYADKLSQSYHSCYNIIRISVRKTSQARILMCGAGILAGVIAYVFISMLVSPEDQQTLLNGYVFPFEQVFANAMLMVGAPVTFFSLLKNASDAVIASERIVNARRLHIKAFVTSAFSVALALAYSIVMTQAFADWRGYNAKLVTASVDWSHADLIVSMVPASIFEPFESISPVPLIVVAMLVTYALVSAGRDFDVLKSAIDVCYGLFTRMLGAVMAVLPIASFLAVLDILLKGGFPTFISMLLFALFVIISIGVLYITYAVRLKVRGVKIIPFIKKLLPLLHENRAIGSAIDAVPYNIRYCVKHFGMDRSKISHALPLLAQINRDGNGFLLMLIAAFYMYATGVDISTVDVLVIAAIALFLSFGAPNEPGSIIIGMFIIINYLNSYDMVCMAILLEVFLGRVQNMVNVTGDMVALMEEEGAK